MKKTSKILILTITLLLLIFASNFVKAAQENYAQISNLSGGDVNLTGSGTADVKLKYNRLNLTWYKADPDIGRTVDGYWVGYKVDFPESLGGNSADQATVEKAKYHTKFTGYEWSAPKSFYNARDGQWFMTGWVQITQEMLNANEGDFELFEAQFDWEGDGEYEQTMKIEINAENVVLDSSKVSTVNIKETGNGASDDVRKFYIETGKSLNEGLVESELNLLKIIENKEGFVKFYEEGKEDEEFSFDDPINDKEITIIALFNKIDPEPEEQPTPKPTVTPKPTNTPKPEKDETPKTGTAEPINYVIVATSTLMILSLAIISSRKK